MVHRTPSPAPRRTSTASTSIRSTSSRASWHSSSTTRSTCSAPARCLGASRRRARVQEPLAGAVPQLPHAGRPASPRTCRARDRGEEGGFDSFDAEPGSGLPGTDAILLQAGEGETLRTNHRVATIKVGREELALIEFELEPSFGGPDLHSHDDHTDAFYVLGGTVELQVGDERIVAGAGSFAAAPPGVVHTFTSGPDGGRLLNIHAPGVDFADRLREMTRVAARR